MAETESREGRSDGGADGGGDGPAEFYEQMYQAAASGQRALPWHRPGPHPLLVDWVTRRGAAWNGKGRRAVVVGCGLGVDAEYVAGLGFDTVGFDVSQTAIALAKKQNPDSAVTYTTADLFDLPPEWLHAFDLVVEIYTAQALPDPPRADAIAAIGRLVAPVGTLLAITFAGDESRSGGVPPWPLTRAQVGAFAADGLVPVAVELLSYSGSPNPESADDRLWRAEFQRVGN